MMPPKFMAAAKYPTVASNSSATSGAYEIQEFDQSVRFDIVSDHSDHYFADPNQYKKQWKITSFKGPLPLEAQKKIMREWKLLKDCLPESITVRVYDERIDLLRAAIVGAEGTPYHDGLYFFDLAFPRDYPKRPPWVHYRSFGYHINPNLYPNGTVCLSLINTWMGNKSERWNPKESTVLQVLLSLQALVLNERPFYNEPRIPVLFSLTKKMSLSYNEEVFLLSCKTMLCLIKNPPKGFDDLVASHFRERARTILGACEAYVNGQAWVGHFESDGNGGGGRSRPSSSKLATVGSRKFRSSLRAMYPCLFAAFCQKGALLHGIMKDLQIRANSSESSQVPTKTNSGLADKIIGKIKKVLRLKKKKKLDDDSNLQRSASS